MDEKPDNRLYREEPLAIFEVLSPSTQSIDQREKLLAYTTIPSLRHYIILHQDRMALLHMKRSGEKWEEAFVTEPILTENPNRFVLLPIKYPEVWNWYKNFRSACAHPANAAI